MVTIIGFKQRENSEGENFFALMLQGGVEFVQSQSTGRFYATARRTSISSTFDEITCQNLIGQQLPGNIHRVDCAEYDYALPETGEVIQLKHRYLFVPEGKTVEEVLKTEEAIQKENATEVVY
jgi:hypothetical protein